MLRPKLPVLAFLLASVLAFMGAAGVQAAEDTSDLILVLDASGSMWGQIDGLNKIVIARDVLGAVIDALPDDQQIGLIAYGHRREADCDDIEMVSPLNQLDRVALKEIVNSLNPKGKTPITRSVQLALEALRSPAGGTTVILVSDGLETCDGDPCAAVRAAKELGADFKLHVVGFDIADENVSELECVAQAGDGLYFSADNAEGLSTALTAAVAIPVAVPDSALSVKGIVNGELFDVAITVTHTDTGKQVASGRTYTKPATNPRRIPLVPGSYDVEVQALGLKGKSKQNFSITLKKDETLEQVVDFSTGELFVGVTRNGDLSDATVSITYSGTTTSAGQGRTYTKDSSNPRRWEITPGSYDVVAKALEISSKPSQRFEGVVIEPGVSTKLAAAFESGTLKVGAIRNGELIDATLKIKRVVDDKEVGRGRTYTKASSNPKSFALLPGSYTVIISEISGVKETISVDIVATETVEKMVELP